MFESPEAYSGTGVNLAAAQRWGCAWIVACASRTPVRSAYFLRERPSYAGNFAIVRSTISRYETASQSLSKRLRGSNWVRGDIEDRRIAEMS
ncbi:hypothetical protein MCEMSEM23_00333 [Rhabdaerophilaceae bacterium]